MTLRPATLREAAEAVADTAEDGQPLRISGAGTAGWAPPGAPGAAVLHTGGLSGILRHDPDDLTVVVGAGTPLAELQAELAPHGQRVALDPARAARGATVGGLLATADAGPLRHAHGSARDLVLGITAVLADGTTARSGGRVIKNVAGYDLGKLFSGAHGTLGLAAELVLRLHPLPPATASYAVPCTDADAFAAARTVLDRPLDPVAVRWAGELLLVRLEGGEDGLADRLDRLAALLPGRALRGEEEAEAWRGAAEPPGGGAFRVTGLPSDLPLVPGARAVRDVAAGVETAPGLDRLDAYRAAAELPGRTFTPLRDGAGPPILADSSAGPVLRAVKRAFDPEGRLPSWP